MKIATLFLLAFTAVAESQGQTSTDSLRSVRDSLVKDSIFKSLELQEVKVVKMKKLVNTDIDKITYDIENDPDSKSSTVIEMLRKVPMVTVDGQDNIKVNGSSSFKVYVNGKPNKLMSNNPTDVLRSMPANSIKKIEVITNPGPKYDAEGVSAVINIITQGSGMEGYTLTLSGNGDNHGGSGGFNGMLKSGKLTVSANANTSFYSASRSYSGSSTKNLITTMEGASDTDNSAYTKYRYSRHYGNIEASYEIDTLRLLSATVGIWGGNPRSRSMGRTFATSPVDNRELYKYVTVNGDKTQWSYIDASIDYQRTFSMKDRMLTFSYKISTNPNTSDSHSDYQDMYSSTEWEDFVAKMKNQRRDASSNSTENTFQIDYATPIGKIHTLETGLKYIIRNNRSENDRYERLAQSDLDYEYDEQHSSHYRHRNDIMAAYLGYGLKLTKFSARLGLRYEHTLQKVNYLLGQGEDFNQHFNDLVPSASINYKLSESMNMRVGYNMNIYRPGIWYLNPYLDDSNPTIISQGNSHLDSEKSQSVSINFSNNTQKLNLNLNLSYNFTNNSIENVTQMMKDTEITGLLHPTGKQVYYSTYANIGKSQRINLSTYVNWNATKNMRIYMNSQTSYLAMNDGSKLRNHGWSAYAYLGTQHTFPHEWRISANIYGMTHQVSLQGKLPSWKGYGLTVSKSWLNKRLNVSLSANDFLQHYEIMRSNTQTDTFIRESWSKTDYRRISLHVSYRFGELKASVKKAERAISNDDVKSGSDISGGK